MEKTITFGIAVWNVEEYLPECLDSVLCQSGDDIEILIVDDGSTDRSGAICDEYAKRDARVRVFHKENGGVSTARNLMLEHACGRWISFIDGDDLLAPSAADTIRKYQDEAFDIIYFDIVFFRYAKSIPAYVIDLAPTVIDEENKAALILTTLYPTRTDPKYVNKTIPKIMGKIFRMDFLRRHALTYDEALRKSQDVAFNLVCLQHIRQAEIVREPIYYYRQNQGSIVSRYNENILRYNLNLVQAFAEIVAGFDGSLREALTERYYLMAMIILKSTLKLNMCHRKNPKSKAQRRQDFEQLIGMDWCQEALRRCNTALLNKSDRIVYDCAGRRDFDALCKYFRQCDRQNSLKIFANRLGLNKIANRIRQKKSVR